MVRFTAPLAILALLASISTEAQTILITRGGSHAVRPGPAENFTGAVRVEMLFEAVTPSHASGGSVTFEPGARTAWHAHPRGQILIVTAGTGRVQSWGGPTEEIRAGDVVRIPAGQKHWHGASPHASMTHIAMTEHRDGTAVEWMEKVSDEQYNGAAGERPQQGAARPPREPREPCSKGRARDGGIDRRGAVRRCVAAARVVSPRSQPGDHLGADCDREDGAARRPPGPSLDNGVQPSEASGLLAHLAIYSGWPSAVSALDVYEQVYTARKVDTAVLRAVGPRLPAPASDAARAKAVTAEMGAVAPKFVQLTNDVVFDDLWRRSDLTVRDRSLVTIAAVAAMGDDDQLEIYLHRGLESGLTRDQIAEAVTHLGFYAGWTGRPGR